MGNENRRHQHPSVPAQLQGTPVTLRVGDSVPDVDLVDQDRQPWRLSAQSGRPLVLIPHRHLA